MNTDILGLDVSVWQDDNSTAQMMDFAKAKNAGARFSYIKSSQNVYVDPDYYLNWNNARAAEMPRGAYHYYDYYRTAIQQAQFFGNLLKNDPGELPWVLDLEHSSPPSDIMTQALVFMQETEQILGKPGLIYTSYGWWSSYGNMKDLWKRWGLWFAYYSTNWEYAVEHYLPKLPWDVNDVKLWQFTSHGDGLLYGAESKNIDMNYFNGTEEEFREFAGITTTPSDPPTNGGDMSKFDTYAKGISLNGNHTSIDQTQLDKIDYVVIDLNGNPMRDNQIQMAYNRSKPVVGYAPVDISPYCGVVMSRLPTGEADFTVQAMKKGLLSGGAMRAVDALLLDVTSFTYPDGTKLNGNWYKALYEHIVEQLYEVYNIPVFCYGKNLKHYTDNFSDLDYIDGFWTRHGGACSINLAFGTRRETLDLADFPLPGILYKPSYIYSPNIYFELISLTNFKFNGLGDANVPTWLWWGTKENLHNVLKFVERPVNDNPVDPPNDPPNNPPNDPPNEPPVIGTEEQQAFWKLWHLIYSTIKE